MSEFIAKTQSSER